MVKSPAVVNDMGSFKLKSVTITGLSIPFRKPFRTARTVQTDAELVLVEAEGTDGTIGYGECTPKPHVTGETSGSAIHALSKIIAPALVGMDLDDRLSIRARVSDLLEFNTCAKSGMEMALDDLVAKRSSIPVYALYNGSRRSLDRCSSVDLSEDDEIGERLRSAPELEKCLFFKIKTGRDPEKDLRLVRLVRENLSDSTKLILDANQGWNCEQLLPYLPEFERQNVLALEQPVRKDDIGGMARLLKSSSLDIMADESLITRRNAMEIIRNSAASMFNLKLMKTGGVYGGIEMAGIANAHDIRCMIGSTMESSLSVSAECHLACCIPNLLCLDFNDPLEHLCGDPFEWTEYTPNKVRVPDTPGFGVRKRDDVVRRYFLSETLVD